MDIISILKNKFVLSLIISLILLVCLYQFDKIQKNNEEELDKKEEKNMIYYCKYLLLFYLISFILVLSVSKGYEYYTKNNLQLLTNVKSLNTNNLEENEKTKKLKLLEERKRKLLELKQKEKNKIKEKQTGGERKQSFTIEEIDETIIKKQPVVQTQNTEPLKIEAIDIKESKEDELTNQKKHEQNFNMGNPTF